MIRRPPRSTQSRSSAASDVYKRQVTSDVSLRLLERNDDGDAMLEFSRDPYTSEEFRSIARVQIPPYIKQFPRDPGAYQTVYAREPGSVAAPTAGLHFTSELLDNVRGLGVDIEHVTLDDGLGTFQPVRVDTVEDHHMHTERFTLPEKTARAVNAARVNHAAVTAIGTTVARTLESCINPDGTVRAGSGETSIFIYPPHEFHGFDHLVTNFHLPKSTLLMLVGAYTVSYTHLRAHETRHDLVCRLLLEKKKKLNKIPDVT